MMLLSTPVSSVRNVGMRPARRVPCKVRGAGPRPVRAFLTSGEQHKATKAADTVDVRFTLTRKVPFGQEIAICGNVEALGSWDLGQALKMTWSEGDRWHARVALPAGAAVEFKFVQQIPHCPAIWEGCQNRRLSVDAAAADLTCEWSAPLSTVVRASPSTQRLADLISGGGDEEDGGGPVSEDDAPAPAFQPAASLAQIADVVKQSLSGGTAAQKQKETQKKVDEDKPDATAAAKPAATVASKENATAAPTSASKPAARTSSKLLAAAAEALSAASVDPLAPPQLPSAPMEGKLKPVQLSAEAEAAVSGIINAAGPTGVTSSALSLDSGAEADDEEEQGAALVAAAVPQPAASQPAPSSGALQTISKVAGTVAMGVGAAAMLSALAVDIADVAMLGAVAAGSVAAMSTPSSSSGKAKAKSKTSSKRTAGAKAAAAEDAAGLASQEGVKEVQTETIAQKASAPGVILAAGVLSAIDVGRKILRDSSPDPAEGGSSSTEGAKKRK